MEKFRADLGLRLKKLFSVLHVKTHLTGAGIRKREGLSPVNLLFVFTNLAFLHIQTVHKGHSFAARVFSVLQAFFYYSLLAYLLEHDEHTKTIGEIFRQLEEETGNLTFLDRLRHHFSTFLTTILNALADFCDSDPRFRSYLDIITNTFNQCSPLQGCGT